MKASAFVAILHSCGIFSNPNQKAVNDFCPELYFAHRSILSTKHINRAIDVFMLEEPKVDKSDFVVIEKPYIIIGKADCVCREMK